MEINDISIGLLLWQIYVLLFWAAIIYAVVKLYKKLIRFLDKRNT